MKEDHMRESQFDQVGKKQKQIQDTRYDGESMRIKLLQEQDQELIEIEKLMGVIKQIALDTSRLVLGIGQKLNIAADSIKQARIKFQGARKELVDANEYEQDASKLKLLLCILGIVVFIVAVLILVAVNRN